MQLPLRPRSCPRYVVVAGKGVPRPNICATPSYPWYIRNLNYYKYVQQASVAGCACTCPLFARPCPNATSPPLHRVRRRVAGVTQSNNWDHSKLAFIPDKGVFCLGDIK